MSKNQRGSGKGVGRPRGVISNDENDAEEHVNVRPPNQSLRRSGGDGRPKSASGDRAANKKYNRHQGGYDSDATSKGATKRPRAFGRGMGRGSDNGNPFQAKGGRLATTARSGQPQPVIKVPQSSGPQRKMPDEKDYNRRFNEVKARREKAREQGIQAGIIHDVDRPHLFKQHLVPEGPGATCEDMCPEFERLQRIIQNDVMGPEYDPDALGEGVKVPREDRMVKKFRRADAGAAAQGPEDLRTPATLKRTLDFLINTVVGEAPHIGNVAHFVWDRTRAIRNDFSIINSTSIPDLRVQIECLERIVRYHLVCMHQLAVRDQQFGNYSHQQDYEQLTKAMMSLSDLYKLAGDRYHSPNEAEFKTYHIVFQMMDPIPDLENVLQTQHGWRDAITKDRQIQRAIQLYIAAQNMADARGPLQPRANHLVTQQCWERFWNVVKSDETSYVLACAAEIFFNLVRRTVLYSIWQSYRTGRDPVDAKMSDWTLDDLIEAFAFDEEDEVIEFCEAFGFSFATNNSGVMYLDLSSVKGTQLPLYSSAMPGQYRSNGIVERKRYGRNLAAVINGLSVAEAQNAGLIDDEYEAESDSQEEEEILREENIHAPSAVRSAMTGNSLFVTGESDEEEEPAARVNGVSSTRPAFNPEAKPFQPTQVTTPFNPFAQQPLATSSVPVGTKQSQSTFFGMPSTFGQPTKFGELTTSASPSESEKASPFESPFNSGSSVAKTAQQQQPSQLSTFPTHSSGTTSSVSRRTFPTTTPTGRLGTFPNETKKTPPPNPFTNTFASQGAKPNFTGGPVSASISSLSENPFIKDQKPGSEIQGFHSEKAIMERSESPSSDSSAPAVIPTISIQPPSEAGSDSNRSTPAPGFFSSLSANPVSTTSLPSAKTGGIFPSQSPPPQAPVGMEKRDEPISTKTPEQQGSGSKPVPNPFGFSATQYPSLSELKSGPTPAAPMAQFQSHLPSFNPNSMRKGTEAKPAASPSFPTMPKTPTATSSMPTALSNTSLTQSPLPGSSTSKGAELGSLSPQAKSNPAAASKPSQTSSASPTTQPTKSDAATTLKQVTAQTPAQEPSGAVDSISQALPSKPATLFSSATMQVNRNQRKDELISQIAEDLFNEPERGILQQFIEFELQQAFAAARDQLALEKLQEEADEFRARKLAVKYCKEWYVIVRRIRARKHGKERRRRHIEAKAKVAALRKSVGNEGVLESVEGRDAVNGTISVRAKQAGGMLPPPLPLPDRRRAERLHRRSRTETTAVKASPLGAFVHRPEGLPIRSLFGHPTNKMPLINTTQTDHFRRSLHQLPGYETLHTARKRSRSIDTYESDDDISVASIYSTSPKGKRLNAMSSDVDLRKTYTSAARASPTPSNATDTNAEITNVIPVDPADADLLARVNRLRQSLLGKPSTGSISASPAPSERRILQPVGKRQISPTIMADTTLHSEEAREIAQALEDSTSFYREELRRAAEQQVRHRSVSEASRRISGEGISGRSTAQHVSPAQHEATKAAYWNRESRFLPKDQYGKSVWEPNRKRFSLAKYEAEEVRKEREREERERRRQEEEERKAKLMRGGASIDDAIEL